jgi:hypothetical protein
MTKNRRGVLPRGAFVNTAPARTHRPDTGGGDLRLSIYQPKETLVQRWHAIASHIRRSTRAAPVALAAVMLLSLFAVPAASRSDSGVVNDGQPTVVAAKSGAPRMAALTRAPRAVPITPASIVGAVTVAWVARWARGRTLLGLQRHRIDDDGDDWRSLLRGAPPALA